MSSEIAEVVVMGRTYKVSCPIGHSEALNRSAEQLNAKLIELRQRSKASNNEQLAVMAALNFCHDLSLEREKNHQYADLMDMRIRMLQDTIEAALVEHGRFGESDDHSIQQID